MEQIPLYCRGVDCGTATLREADGRLEISGEMPDPGDGLYRAVLVGTRGELSLGVMEPRDGSLVLRRKPALCDIARIGTVQRVQAGCSFSFHKKPAWDQTSCPAELFRDPFLRERLTQKRRVWWRRGTNRLTLAVPLKPNAPFPLEALFCFARAERIEGELCAVFTFDENDTPVQAAQC